MFELRLDARGRAVLHAAGIATADYDPDTIAPSLENPDDRRDPKLAFWWIDVRLGSVEASRRTVHGLEEILERTELSLHADREGDERFNGIRARVIPERERPLLWSDRLTATFHGVVRGVVGGDLPSRFDGLREDLPSFDADILAREPVDSGTVFSTMIEDWWTRGLEIDLSRLLVAIEAGATPSHKTSTPWTVSRSAERTRLTWPLMLEAFRVDIAHLREPRWLASRYWLTIDVTPEGRLDDVSVRTDADQTWSAEGDADTGWPGLATRISETAYSAIDFVNDFVRREP